jgi:hypothetical protein
LIPSTEGRKEGREGGKEGRERKRERKGKKSLELGRGSVGQQLPSMNEALG